MRLSVIGLGYLGVTHAVCMASLGHEVIGIDIDPARVEALSRGTLPFHEPGVGPLLTQGLDAHRLTFSTSPAEAARHATVHFLTVGTPQRAESPAADLSQVHAAVDSLIPALPPGEHLVVGKSTVPVGTAAELALRARERAPEGVDVEIAWNPEFLREGHGVEDTLAPDRIVIGVNSDAAARTLSSVYAEPIGAGAPLLRMDLASAELVKSAANAFLATKISFINAMAEVCEAAGADISHLSRALGLDSRIGPRFLHAGLGFGGGCLPKDIRAFIARAEELGVPESLAFLSEVDAINQRRRLRAVSLAEEMLGGVEGRRVTVLGAAFKPHSDDTRDSPALAVAEALRARGARVTVYDPEVRVGTAPSLEGALEGAELLILATEWECFRTLDPRLTGRLTAARRIIDARNVLCAEEWRREGWQVRALGR
ncbi:UDP-glucose/GDP-mannose dehydrogenase family protein [Corynebacterium uropygiale]|uniref:UDP-glucose 6-dehydrogenase n=1 Tax=Corynebacterium uropygiale TaxID=1775911 RepID=A0A9X1QQK0_9CORY|nr:UDP-glucose/GDP-mannose dehydrogenase family protein [Corynebacterium uropygiale]MCF4007301.1 UDP-glucose/GDP-mannose dehydrogenase family protein [Corynebacterium uropygiale]